LPLPLSFHLASAPLRRNGNQKNLTATGEAISWNALNQPISMNGVTATYDALGRMVETGSGSAYQQFVFRPSGALLAIYNAGTSTLVKGTVPLPGGDTAIYNASGLSYLRHTDWLGSSRLATTWAHAVYSKEAYAPFGETYNEAGTADRSFTGQDQDVVTGSGGTGAYDFLYRKHDPSAGRWLSPDPYGWNAVDQTNPQSLNRYGYVLNSPASLIDHLGLCWETYVLYTFYSNNTYTVSAPYNKDNGLPCGPPSGCTYLFNANGAYQGLQCNSGSPWAYCILNSCPTGPSTSVPNNGPTQAQKQQACLDKINNSPDGKLYNFFSLASPWLAPDTFAWDTSHALAGGAFGFLTAAAKNWARTPLGTASGAVAGTTSTLLKATLIPIAGAATVAQLAVHIGCAF
jgi:RHS repeat-associated protein